MAVSEANIPSKRFLHMRAAQLAAIVLTRQPEVSVEIEDAPNLYALDLIVSLLNDGQDHGRRLGIEIEAVRPNMRLQTVLGDIGECIAYRPFTLKRYSVPDLPICVYNG